MLKAEAKGVLMRTLILTLFLVLCTACGKQATTESPDSSPTISVATQAPSDDPPAPTVQESSASTPATPALVSVTFKYQYMTGSMNINPTHRTIYFWGECDQSVQAEEGAVNAQQLQTDYPECQVTVTGSDYVVDCLDVATFVQLEYANRGLCDWEPPYAVTQ